MRQALIIGGTGVISSEVVKRALSVGWQVTLLNRGTKDAVEGVSHIKADARDRATMEEALHGRRFDAVCDFITFTQDQALQNAELFQEKAGQYLFVSSATVYQKPPSYPIINEGTPRYNPFSQYARDKMACEDAFRTAYEKRGFPITVVRPNYTYGDTMLPWVPNSRSMRYSVAHRLLSGKAVVVPGDGTSFFTLTHSADFAVGFVGLMGNARAIGHDFHITGDQAMTWDGYLHVMADALGVKAKICHIASEAICRVMPEEEGSLLGDKSVTALFDNSKIKAFVPGFTAKIPFEEGIRRTLAYYQAHPEMMGLDTDWDSTMDTLVARYGK